MRTSADRPKKRSHIACEMTSAIGPFGVASSTEKVRPIAGVTPKVSKKLRLTMAATARSASAPLLTLTAPAPPDAARLETDCSPSRQSRQTCGGMFTLRLRCETCQIRASPSLGNGSGCRKAAFAVVNIRLVAPRPIPSVRAATAEKSGTRSSDRTASRKSRINASMDVLRGNGRAANQSRRIKNLHQSIRAAVAKSRPACRTSATRRRLHRGRRSTVTLRAWRLQSGTRCNFPNDTPECP